MSVAPWFNYMRCKSCNNLFKQEMGTVAFAKASFGKCPKCGGDSVLDEEMETKRKKEIQEREEIWWEKMKQRAKRLK